MTRYASALAALIVAALLAPAASASEAPDLVARWRAAPDVAIPAAEVDLDAFRWTARPVIVFADTPADPAFQRQMELLADRSEAMVERDVVIITDTDPAAETELRRQLRPRGFQLTLIGKDGGVKLRKPFPWDVRELNRTIDKMPMRQQEIRERR